MTHRPGFWFTVVMLSTLFGLALAYKADGVGVGDVLAWIFAVAVLTAALFAWAGKEA